MGKQEKEESWTESAEVFTKPSVALYMLQELKRAVGFRHWYKQRVLEPSCGHGAFVLILVDLLIQERHKGLFPWSDPRLANFLTAVDISTESVDYIRKAVSDKLVKDGCPCGTAWDLVQTWFVCDDFLTHDFQGAEFDVVVGNPPYIRFDDVPSDIRTVYQLKYHTFAERCDIYVPFIERSLQLLSERGAFSFICANRFAKNQYGRQLRRLITSLYHTHLYLNVEHADAFLQKVSAYPAIIVIDRKKGGETYAGELSDIERLDECKTTGRGGRLSRFERWYSGDEPWISTNSRELCVWRDIAAKFPVIEESAPGTKIGIGVATGADGVFMLKKDCEVEPDCKLPVVGAEDIRHGRIEWDGRYMLNPYDSDDSSKMRDFSAFPIALRYVMGFEDLLRNRHCAKAHPREWLRTIDRINYAVLRSPKVLMPDIQQGGVAALDLEGRYYPHHNVYYVISTGWDVRALCTIMRSSFVTEQVKKVSVSMRGGSIRYQSRNLRQIHIPNFAAMKRGEIADLAKLAESGDRQRIDDAVWAVVNRILA